MGDTVRMIPPGGGPAVDVPVEDVAIFADRDFTPESTAQRAAAITEGAREDYYTSPQAKFGAAVAGFGRSATGGISDAMIDTLGTDQDRELMREIRARNPITSTAGEVVGSFTGVGALASKAGSRVAAKVGEGGGARAIARAGVKGTVEGGIQGVGEGVTQVSLSDKPVDFEHAAATIGANALFGGVTGGAVGAGGKGLELGLAKAKSHLDKVAAQGVKNTDGIADDLVNLDRKGLRAAEKVELDAIEAARVPARAQVADEIQAFRKELKENKLWLATKDASDAELRAIGKRTFKADKALDNLLDDPKALAENPKSTLSALRKQEAALDELVNKHGPKLRESFAADTSGVRAKALDYAETALERNRSLQAKIGDLTGKPASQRLEQIQAAVDKLNAPKVVEPKTGIGDVAGDFAVGHLLGAAAGIPYVGPVLAAGRVAMGVVKKLGANSAAAAERASKAVQTFLDVTQKATPHAPILATKVLAGVRFSQEEKAKRGPRVKQQTAGKRVHLADAFKERADELRAQVVPAPDGSVQMHPTAREQMAAKLAPIRAIDPVLADRIETNKARAIAFLASKLPKKPDIAGMQLGPDQWKPSDMEMRQFARYVAAVEDPHGVIERLSTGTVSPEDAEALRSVYPEMHADMTQQIMAQLATLKKPLPYARRLSLSILTGVPVDPALDPRVLNILQSTFAREAGTSGGAEAPRAEPAFGSVSKEIGTPAQRRQEGSA